MHGPVLMDIKAASASRSEPARPVWPTVLLALGLGGSFDGIVLHQILQWHHMLSSHVPPDSVANLELNTLADGLFHASTWVLTGMGILQLWAAARRGTFLTWSTLFGGLLAGWGAFKVIEGLINHQLLGVHHVRPGPDQMLYDLGFLAWGALMLVGGITVLQGRNGRGRYGVTASR